MTFCTAYQRQLITNSSPTFSPPSSSFHILLSLLHLSEGSSWEVSPASCHLSFSTYFWFMLHAWKVGRIMWLDWKQPMGDMAVTRKKNMFGSMNLPQLSLALISKSACAIESPLQGWELQGFHHFNLTDNFTCRGSWSATSENRCKDTNVQQIEKTSSFWWCPTKLRAHWNASKDTRDECMIHPGPSLLVSTATLSPWVHKNAFSCVSTRIKWLSGIWSNDLQTLICWTLSWTGFSLFEL